MKLNPPPLLPRSQGIGALPQTRWPGRLVGGGKTLDDFVAIEEEAHADPSWTVRVFRSTSVPTLQIRAQWREIGPVTEWISTLVNASAEPSERVTEVRSLAAAWRTRGAVDFYGNRGSICEIDDFADRTVYAVDVVHLMPQGGKSSNGTFPFFALTDRQDSLAVAIGWSGQWCATVRCSAEGDLHLEIGLPRVGFVLRPGESVRLPSVLLARAPKASADQARRLVRAHLTKHVVPRAPDGGSPNFTVHGPTMYDAVMGRAAISEAGEIRQVERAAEMGFEAYWIDAGWYGNSGNWEKEIGNWKVRRDIFPRGLRPISDRAHELGMKFVFWHDPERAQPDSETARAHPELFLHFPDDSPSRHRGLLLNLGDPRARELAFKTASDLITEFNADVYRQDFNIWPQEAWRAADAPDRIGMTEIRHVEGLYEFWDRLRAAHPGLLIDNCSEGGRRIDLETMRRSFPLWRSDVVFSLIIRWRKDTSNMDITNQVQCWGLGQWLPDHGGPADTLDAYAIRSALATGFMAYRPLPLDDNAPEAKDARAAVAENKRLRPLIAEERIDLIRPTLEMETWMAFQHHRRSDSRGFLVALRGPGANDDDNSKTLSLEHIDANGTYRVTRWDDYVVSSPVEMPGEALKELPVTIAQRRGSVLIEYEPVNG